jgi:hypothetical protein
VVAVKIEQHFIVHQLRYAAGILPVHTHADVRLLHLVKAVIHGDVGAALQSVFNEFFQLGQFLLRYLGNIFTQFQTVMAEISIEIISLVIFPIEFLLLNAVLSKLHSIHLGKAVPCNKSEQCNAGQPANQSVHKV